MSNPLSAWQSFLFYTTGTVFVEETAEEQEVVTYRLAIYDTASEDLRVLHGYSVDVDWNEDDAESVLSPPLCVDAKNENAVFWENGELKKLSLVSNQIQEMPYNYDAPDFMVFERGADALLLLYYDTCVTYDLENRCDVSIHQYEGLNYQLAGTHSALSLLLFDERLNPYEWNLLQSRPAEKYKYSKRSITDVYLKNETQEVIVTFDNDSLIVLGKNGELAESFHYGKPDSQTCMSLYSNEHDCMIFLHDNDSYEFVECHYLSAGKTQYAYFDSVEKNKIKSITLPSS